MPKKTNKPAAEKPGNKKRPEDPRPVKLNELGDVLAAMINTPPVPRKKK